MQYNFEWSFFSIPTFFLISLSLFSISNHKLSVLQQFCSFLFCLISFTDFLKNITKLLFVFHIFQFLKIILISLMIIFILPLTFVEIRIFILCVVGVLVGLILLRFDYSFYLKVSVCLDNQALLKYITPVLRP